MSRTIIGDLALNEDLLAEAVRMPNDRRRETLKRNLSISSVEVGFLDSWLDKTKTILGGFQYHDQPSPLRTPEPTLPTIHENDVYPPNGSSDTAILVDSGCTEDRSSKDIGSVKVVGIIFLNIFVLSAIALLVFFANYGF